MERYNVAHYSPPAVSSVHPRGITLLVNDNAQHLTAPRGYHDRGIDYYARVAQGGPAQAQVIAPPVAVCTNFIFPHTHI